MAAVTVSSVKNHALAADKANVTLTFETKYVGEHSLKMPVGCIGELIGLLARIQSELGEPAAAGQSAQPAIKPQAEPAAPPQNSAQPPASQPPANAITFRRPKNCMVTAETSAQKLVLMIFDFQSPQQTGFALDAKGARSLAANLVKNADAVLSAAAKD